MSGVRHDGRPGGEEPMPEGRDEQAADWCLRLAEDSLTADEQRAFDAWLEVPAHRAAFEDALLVWQGAEGVAERPEAIRLRTRALESFRDANQRRWRARHRRRGRYWSLAAALSLAVVAGVSWQLLRIPVQVYETGTGERRVAVLDDGSRLSLDAASRVEVRMGRERRELRLLAGRAKFDVAKDALRPFSVAVGDKLVVATGTAFSVEVLRERMHVILYEGRVEVLERPRARWLATRGQPQRIPTSPGKALTPGHELVAPLDEASVGKPVIGGTQGSETASLPAEPMAILPVYVDKARSLAWETGQLSFHNEPLALAVERVNRHVDRKLIIQDPMIASLKVNGVFTAGDAAAFVEGVTRLLPVRATEGEKEVVLTTR